MKGEQLRMGNAVPLRILAVEDSPSDYEHLLAVLGAPGRPGRP